MAAENSAVGLPGKKRAREHGERRTEGAGDAGGERGWWDEAGIGGREMQIENLRPPLGGCIGKKIGAGRE